MGQSGAEQHEDVPERRLLANLYSGNVYIWSTADQVRPLSVAP